MACSDRTRIGAEARSQLAWLVPILLATACASAPEAPLGDATIYPAARVRTMNPGQPTAEAIAVAGGRFVGVGSVADLSEQLEGGYRVRVDERFRERVLLPGFVENHLHPIMAAVLLPMEWVTPYDWNLPDRRVEGLVGHDAYLARLRELDALHPEGEPLFAWGYHPLFHGELARGDLDAISSERPIVAWHRSFHEIIVNTAALEWLGISRADVAGHHQVDWEKGHFFETGLFVAVHRLNPTILSPDWIRRGLALTRDAIHMGGVTTVGDMSTGNFSLELEHAAMLAHITGADVPFRTLLIPSVRAIEIQQGSPEAAFATIESLPERNREKLEFVRQVKLFSDGAFFSQLSQLSEGYLDGHHGEWLMEPADLLATARRYWNAGYQIHVHVTGDLGATAALDALDALQAETRRDDHRYTLHHYGYGTDAQAQQIADADVLVSANPYYLYQMSDIYSEVGYGPQRAERISPLGGLANRGVTVALHSDFTMAPIEPLRLAWVSVNRLAASGRVMAPEEKLTVMQALRAITIDSARTIRLEEEIGSIEVGKRADLAILERDPLAVAPEALGDIQVWGTMLDGEIFPVER